jgi:hypothetical protein
MNIKSFFEFEQLKAESRKLKTNNSKLTTQN